MNAQTEIVKLSGVSKVFADGTVALNGVSLSFFEHEFAVVCGKNGSGKSVLMSLISGLDEPTSGTVYASDVGLVFQSADAQILGETPLEDVMFGLKNAGFSKSAALQKAEAVLLECGLFEKRNAQARTLSGGEKRRLAVAAMRALNRSVLIFDEPFANLDYPGVQQVCDILKSLKEDGTTVIVLTHELEKILALADRLVILEKGSVAFNGSVKDGLALNLEQFGIKNPLAAYAEVSDLFWGSGK